VVRHPIIFRLAELIGGECKAQSTVGVVPPTSICNAAIAFERPANLKIMG